MQRNSSGSPLKSWFQMYPSKNRTTVHNHSSSGSEIEHSTHNTHQKSAKVVNLNSPSGSGDDEALDRSESQRFKFPLSKKPVRLSTKDSEVDKALAGDVPDTAQDIPEKIIIALLGPSGCGKSTFIKLATGRNDVAVGCNLDPCTTEIKAFEVTLEGNKTITFVDTPGYDLDGNNRALKMLRQWLKKQSTSEKTANLNAVLLFHRITDNRMTIATQSHINEFEKLVGKSNGHKSIFLVTTMWNEIDSEAGKKREELLKNVYWKRMIAGGSNAHRFWNTPSSAWDIVTPIIRGHSGDIVLPPHVQTLLGSSVEMDEHQYLDSEQALRAMEQIFYDQQRLLDKLQTIVHNSQGGGQTEQLREVLVEERTVSSKLGSLLGHLKKQRRIRFWFTGGDHS